MAASSVDWDLLRVFLALMRANALREAAAALGTSHPTVRRKLHTLETQLGVVLFERTQQGLRATAEAAELLALAESVEASVDALARQASGLSPQLAGRSASPYLTSLPASSSWKTSPTSPPRGRRSSSG